MGHYTTKPQQNLEELRDYIAFLKEQKIRSFLEIGSKFGGVLWAVSRIIPKGGRIVSVDMPNGQWGRSDSMQSLSACIQHLKREGFQASLFLDDSTKQEVVNEVRRLAPFDAIFIDANHTESYVRADFANYGPMANIVSFHDIGWTRATPANRLPIEVPKVWAEIKETYKGAAHFKEIRRDTDSNGIGIMRWQ